MVLPILLVYTLTVPHCTLLTPYGSLTLGCYRGLDTCTLFSIECVTATVIPQTAGIAAANRSSSLDRQNSPK